MVSAYHLLKAALDPVVFLLLLIAVGFFVSLGRRKKRSGQIILPVTFLVLYIVSVSPVSNALCYILEKEYLLQNNADVDYLDIVVVLGGGVSDNKFLTETMPSPFTNFAIPHLPLALANLFLSVDSLTIIALYFLLFTFVFKK